MKTDHGFFGGMRCFFRGLGFITRTPGMWGLAATPMIIAGVLMVVLGTLGLWGAFSLAVEIAGDSGFWSWIFAWVLRIVLGAVSLLLAFLFTMALAQPLSSSALDKILRAREAQLDGPAWAPVDAKTNFVRGLKVSFTALGLSLPIFAVLTVIGIAAPPALIVTIPLKLFLGALLAAWDFMDYPMGARHMNPRARLAWIRRNFAAYVGFATGAMLLLMIPLIGYLMLVPVGVAGAATLMVEIDDDPMDSRLSRVPRVPRVPSRA